jgi:hypothetical protein
MAVVMIALLALVLVVVVLGLLLRVCGFAGLFRTDSQN